jgi:hypothetical protein
LCAVRLRVTTVLLVAAGLAAASVATAAVAAGRVVRVERRRGPAPPAPRALQIQGVRSAIAYGFAPPVGTSLVIVDPQGILATAEIEAVSARQDGCSEAIFDVSLVATQWQRMPRPGTFGFWGVGVDRGAKLSGSQLRSPTGRVSEYVWAGLDRDGDDSADFLAVARLCPEGPDSQGSQRSPGRGASSCVDAFVRSGRDGWDRVARDVWHSCP